MATAGYNLTVFLESTPFLSTLLMLELVVFLLCLWFEAGLSLALAMFKFKLICLA